MGNTDLRLVQKTKIIPNVSEKEAVMESLQGVREPFVLSFVNVNALNLANRDHGFFEDILNSDLLLRDGFGVEILMRLFGRNPGLNMNGTDLIPEIVRSSAGKKIFLCGTELRFANEARRVIEESGGTVIGCIDGFQNFSFYLDEIGRAKPDVVVLAMGMPKQERLAIQLKSKLNHPCLIVNGGAILDFYAGRYPRAPLWMRRIRCEWVYRFMKEPRRLWRRYLVGNTVFLSRVFAARMRSGKNGASQAGVSTKQRS